MNNNNLKNIRNLSVIAHIDSGKCYSLGTKIILFDGKIKTVESLTTKDSVIGLDGKEKHIIEIHQGQGKLYEIEQKLGDNYIVNGEHILVLKFTNAEGIFWDPRRKYYRARYIQNLRLHDKCFQHDKSIPLNGGLKKNYIIKL